MSKKEIGLKIGKFALIVIILMGIKLLFQLNTEKEPEIGGDDILRYISSHPIPANFIFTEHSFTKLKEENIPEDILKSLEPLKYRAILGEDEFLDVIKKHIGDEQTARYRTFILKHTRISIEQEMEPELLTELRERLDRISEEQEMESEEQEMESEEQEMESEEQEMESDKEECWERLAMIQALPDMEGEKVIGLLLELLDDEDCRVEYPDIWEALGEIGKPAAAPLLDSLTQPDSPFTTLKTMALIRALVNIGELPTIEPIIALLHNDDWWLRFETVWALGELADKRATEPLIEILQNEARAIPHSVAESREIRNLLGMPELYVFNKNSAIKHEFGLINDIQFSVNPLSLAMESEDWSIPARAAVALGKIGDPQAILPLSTALHDEVWTVRLAAVVALGKIKDRQATESLINSLQDQSRPVQRMAVWALGEVGDERAIKSLKSMRTETSLEGMRGSIDNALEKIEFRRAISEKVKTWEALEIDETADVEALIADLFEEDDLIREKAVLTLGKLGDEQAIKALIEVFQEESKAIRATAAWASRENRDTQAVIEAFQEEPGAILAKTAWALGEIGDNQALEVLASVLTDEKAISVTIQKFPSFQKSIRHWSGQSQESSKELQYIIEEAIEKIEQKQEPVASQ